ncbi:MAG: YraN family protein [Haliea sp.]|nr:YraN family protein [Haliea sp.]
MKSLGHHYESRAVLWLCEAGQQLLARNFRAKTGEIDLITLEPDCLVFVEVKARSHPGFGGAAVTVDRRKQQRILRTAQVFLQRNPQYAHLPCRFDVLAFEPPQSPDAQEIRWIKSAFTA